MRLATPVLLAMLAALPAVAQERVGVRVGSHPTHGRVVFDWPRGVDYRVEETAGRVTLRFAAPVSLDLSAVRRPPRNVEAVSVAGNVAEITIPPGVRMRHFRLGTRVVVDLLDAAPVVAAEAGRPAAPAAAPAGGGPATARAPAVPPPAASSPPSARPGAQAAAPSLRATTPAASGQPGAPSAAPSPRAAPPVGGGQPGAPAVAAAPHAALPASPASGLVAPMPSEPAAASPLPAAPPVEAPPVVAPAPAPVGPAAVAVRLLPGPRLAVPTPAETGAALFRRGGTWLMVLDAPLPLDLAALRNDSALAAAEVSTGPQATTLRLPDVPFAAPRLRRQGGAWLLEPTADESATRAILPEFEPGPPARLLLRAPGAAGSVSVLDPETGAPLLVGTLRDNEAAAPLGRRTVSFDLLPTRLGVALLPRADTVTLVALDGRFVAGAAPGATLALGAEVSGAALAAAAAALSRSFDLPAEPLAGLQERLRNATAAVAAAPPLGRGPPRLRTAEALLALGLPQEAQSMATLAMRDDPQLARDTRARALQGAAALLAGRLAEAGGLDRAGETLETDELALWRALLASARGQNAAPAIAAGLPLLLSYPEPLQARLAPLAGEALAAGGESAATRRLLEARPQDAPSLALTRARLLEAEGDVDGALAAYDAVAQGRDRRARAIALRRAAELRLSSGKLDAAGAARALEATLAAWRGDSIEIDNRLRLAELLRAAGQPHAAFDLLRETEQGFPDIAATLRPLQTAALLETLRTDPPLNAVVLFDAHADLLPADSAAEPALVALADGLAALDLVDRAGQVLRRAAARAEPEARARLGARLARLALGAGDAAGALAALEESAIGGLPGTLQDERRLLEARALARAGRLADAVARYREAGSPAAAELAALLEERQDWAGAAAAMRTHLAATLPPTPEPLTPEQGRLVARTAALLALAGDTAGLADLRAAQEGRMSGGAMEDAFTLLTAAPMDGLDDLPRLRQELDRARRLPSRLEALRNGSAPTR